jgi:hypothetical protein
MRKLQNIMMKSWYQLSYSIWGALSTQLTADSALLLQLLDAQYPIAKESWIQESMMQCNTSVDPLHILQTVLGFFVGHPVNDAVIAVYEYPFQPQMSYKAADAG